MVLVAQLAQILTLALATLAVDASTAQVRLPRVAIQPVRGAPDLVGASLRSQIANVMRARGYRVITTLPGLESAAQYSAVARDRRVTAFVVCDLDSSGRRRKLTIVVLNGDQGSELGRWTVNAPLDNPGKFLAGGFWKHLGSALTKAHAPELPVGSAPPPVRLDATRNAGERKDLNSELGSLAANGSRE